MKRPVIFRTLERRLYGVHIADAKEVLAGAGALPVTGRHLWEIGDWMFFLITADGGRVQSLDCWQKKDGEK